MSVPTSGRAGDAAKHVRTTDWSKTPLGARERWPMALISQVRTMLATRQPMCVFWGPELVNIYNDGFLPILGEKHPSAMGQRAEDCWREAWPIIGPQIAQVMHGENVFREEVVVPIARGGRIDDAWWNYSYSPLFDDAGQVAGVLVICTEITSEVFAKRRLEAAKHELERARHELHAVFMNAPMPLCILSGAEHRFTLANEPYRKLVSRDVLGKTIREAFTAEEIEPYLPIMERVYRTGEPEIVCEVPLRIESSDGSISDRWLDIGHHPHRDGSHAITGLLVVVHDVTAQVTARKQLEELALQQANGRKQAETLRNQAERANRAKDEFLATVSHELRTPLTAILGWSRLLVEAPERDRIDKGLAVIERNAQAQAKLIDDILDVSRIISGKLNLVLGSVELMKVVESAVESARLAANAKSVELSVSLGPKIQIVADEDRLQQVVWNLLANAVKFTPTGGTVFVRASGEGDRARIRIEDTGRGIAPDFLPHVFDRFRQGDGSTTKQHGGLGLGLAIVRHLVELHGGTVSAQSAGEGRGATFEVDLPLRAREAPESVDAPPSARDLDKTTAVVRPSRPLRGVRVLVVDDQRDARELVAIVLEDAAAEVFQAASVAAAFAVLTKEHVDVVVSDIAMPCEDGYAFVARLRASATMKAVPAVALTAFARADDRERALRHGFDDHIAKPIQPARLIACVSALVGR